MNAASGEDYSLAGFDESQIGIDTGDPGLFAIGGSERQFVDMDGRPDRQTRFSRCRTLHSVVSAECDQQQGFTAYQLGPFQVFVRG